MSKDKIVASALSRFANQGYYHTSLAEIADDVGIRKPSIYAHFSSKEKIFLSLLHEAFIREKSALSIFDLHTASRQGLYEYFFNIPLRYVESGYLRFWIRALYMPPFDLEKEVKNYDHQYSLLIDEAINSALQRIEEENGLLLSLPHVRDGFTGMLRGLHAELLYNGAEIAAMKAVGMWRVFELSFSR